MSHSFGFVVFPRGELRWYEFDGTSDFVIPKLYRTGKEVEDNWRSWATADCKCHGSERVLLYSDYGGGFFWFGRACLSCMAVTAGHAPLDEDDLKYWDTPRVPRGPGDDGLRSAQEPGGFIDKIFTDGFTEAITVDLPQLLKDSGAPGE